MLCTVNSSVISHEPEKAESESEERGGGSLVAVDLVISSDVVRDEWLPVSTDRFCNFLLSSPMRSLHNPFTAELKIFESLCESDRETKFLSFLYPFCKVFIAPFTGFRGCWCVRVRACSLAESSDSLRPLLFHGSSVTQAL